MAEEQAAPVSACEKNLDLDTLPPYTPMIQKHQADLEAYFTCKAAIKENVQVCNVFADGTSQKANCQEAYTDYYEVFGKMYRYRRISDGFLEVCSKKGGTKNACAQWSDILLSGNWANCDKIEGILPEDILLCKDMASTTPSGAKAYFMMALRSGNSALCDQYLSSPVAAVCKGLLTKAQDGCQLNAGAIRFKKYYCQNKQEEGTTHGQ